MNLIEGFAERGYYVDLVLAHATGPYLSGIPGSVRLVDLKSRRVLLSLPALVSYLRREQPVAMLSFLHYANIVAIGARRLAGVPKRLVVSEHNTLSSTVQHTSDPRLRLMPLLIRCFYRWADDITAVSEGVAEDLAKTAEIPRNCINVIYNPVVTPGLQMKAQAFLEHPWFAPGEPPVLIAVGRLAPQKDFPTLIRAFALVRDTRPARLLILGEGDERPALEALIRELDLMEHASLPGFVENPYALMSGASVFVLSSKWEGLPTVLIEALYCGVPVVATDCRSGPREILDNGQYGQLVPVGDPVALAQAIGNALDGGIPRPPSASWQPFELNCVVEQYLNTLLDT